MVCQPEAVGAGWDGGTLQQDKGTSSSALGWCPPLLILPHLLVDQAGAVPRQGLEAAKAESQERMHVGMFSLSRVSLCNARNLGILRLLKRVITRSGRALVTFHLGAERQN